MALGFASKQRRPLISPLPTCENPAHGWNVDQLFQKITLARIEADGFPDTRAFDEIAILFQAAFARLGSEANITINEFSDQGINLVIGAIVIDRIAREDRPVLPPNSIILNLEQVHPASPWMTPSYADLLRSFPVWDYNLRNIDRLRSDFGVENTSLVQIGYLPSMRQIVPAAVQDVDVLFYGKPSSRRRHILNAMKERGLNVVSLENVYGAERDAWIARSKIVMNMHYYDFGGVAEIIRLSYLLSNEKAVVSECGEDTDMDEQLRQCVMAVPYNDLVQACMDLAVDETGRNYLSHRGFEIFSGRDQVSYLRDAIARTKLPKARNF
jgi:hypothetical protein